MFIFVVYALPFFIMRKMSSRSSFCADGNIYVSRRRLWPVYAIFSLGLVCILIAIARGIVPGTESSSSLVTAFQDAEVASAQILACLPMTRKVLQRVMVWFRSRNQNESGNEPASPLSNEKITVKTTVDAA